MSQIPDDIAAFVRDTALDDIVEALIDRYSPSLILTRLGLELDRYAEGCRLTRAQVQVFDDFRSGLDRADCWCRLTWSAAGLGPEEMTT